MSHQSLRRELDGMTVEQMRAYAAENDVDLAGASRKAQIRARILEAAAASARPPLMRLSMPGDYAGPCDLLVRLPSGGVVKISRPPAGTGVEFVDFPLTDEQARQYRKAGLSCELAPATDPPPSGKGLATPQT